MEGDRRAADEPRRGPAGCRRRRPERASRRWWLLCAWSAALVQVASCVVGSEDDPGCHRDAECRGGVCRGGACFAVGPGSTPIDPAVDAGDEGADAPDGDGSGDADDDSDAGADALEGGDAG